MQPTTSAYACVEHQLRLMEPIVQDAIWAHAEAVHVHRTLSTLMSAAEQLTATLASCQVLLLVECSLPDAASSSDVAVSSIDPLGSSIPAISHSGQQLLSCMHTTKANFDRRASEVISTVCRENASIGRFLQERRELETYFGGQVDLFDGEAASPCKESPPLLHRYRVALRRQRLDAHERSVRTLELVRRRCSSAKASSSQPPLDGHLAITATAVSDVEHEVDVLLRKLATRVKSMERHNQSMAELIIHRIRVLSSIARSS